MFTIEDIRNTYKPIFEKYDVSDAWVFGSQARGTATKWSDVDLLFTESQKLLDNPKLVMSLFEELTNATDKSVDLVSTYDLHMLNDDFIKALNAEKIRL